MDLIRETSHKAYIKRWALDTCINHIARTISQTKFQIEFNGERTNDATIDYKLNVRPNTDESAATFWQKVVRKLIYDNEVLIVVTDTKDLVIADDFDRESYGLYDDIFKDVVVNEFKFERNFRMSEVIYLEYNNSSISNMLYGLFSDYGDIFGRLITANLMNNQIRATLEMDANTPMNESTQQNIQNFINKAYESYSKNDVAIVPLQKGYAYKEHSRDTATGKSQIDDLVKVPEQLLKYVAQNLGIPVGLVMGETADVEAMTNNYMKFCINPILHKITDELNAKLYSERTYKEGKRVKAISIDGHDPIQKAEAVDKLIASGVFTGNQVLKMFNLPPSEDKAMDEPMITKNYQSMKDLEKGGENV
ncbi:phage portal protein [Staphylococcus massiliensis]|uniref:phage portal protein n=1 Tax=Staphylococcus massiliensis TaxID=555791 RepID=UPI001EDFA1ED|nr:phage portal protein [Staphylococcus massiliensis]